MNNFYNFKKISKFSMIQLIRKYVVGLFQTQIFKCKIIVLTYQYQY